MINRRTTLLTMIGAPLFAGCSKIFGNSTAHPDNVINFWGMGREGEVVGQLLPKFLSEHPDIQVKVQQLPWTAAHEKLLTAFAGNTMPDISQIGNSWLPEFVAIGAVDRLDGFLPNSNVKKADYFDGIWDTNVIDSKLYGIPWYVDTRVLFYRKDTLRAAGFDKIPKDWDGFRNALRKIKTNVGKDKYSIILPLNEYEPLFNLSLSVDDPLLKDNATLGNFDSKGYKQTLSYYKSLFDEGLAPLTDASQISNIYDEFARGLFSFYITGPWNIGEFKRRLPEDMQDDWATAPMPIGPCGVNYSSAGGSSLVVMKNSQKKPSVWKLIEFLSLPEVQKEFYDLTGDLPAQKSAWAMGNLDDDKYSRAFYEQLQHVKPAPPAPEWERIAQEMRIVTEQMLRGQFDVNGAVLEMNKRADRILEKRRWILKRGQAHE